MSSTVSQRDDSFVQMNYEGLLDAVLQVLAKGTIFTPLERGGVTSLIADVDKIAYTVARQSERFHDPLGKQAKVARVATVHFGDSEERFNAQIKQIYEQLQTALEVKLQERGQTLPDFVGQLLAPLPSFTGNPKSLGLSYPFSSHKNLTKQRLTLGETAKVKPILRFHKLTVTVYETNKFRGQVEQALRNYSEQQFGEEANEDDLEDLNDILDALVQDTTSDIHKLLHVVNTESLGKIKQEAQICYLEFLRDNLGPGKGTVYLQDLIRRLRLIKRYLGDAEAADSEFRVSFAGGMPVDYRDIFGPSHVFNQLPIIPVIEGSLGESKDEEKGTRTFVFGLKMKLNGKVQNQEHVKSPDAFDYYLELLDPKSALHQARLQNENKVERFKQRVLQLTLLYFFTFNRFGDSSYSDENIISDFKTHILPKFQGSDVRAQYKVLAQIRHKLNQPPVRTGLKVLERWLRDSITEKSFQERPYPFHLLIKRSLLEQDLDTVLQSRTFFRPLFNSKNKEVLRHIAISQPRVDNSALCNLTAEITISNLHYFQTGDRQQFSMSYHVDNYQTLPVLMVPKEQSKVDRKRLADAWSKYPNLIFPYWPSYLDLDEVRPYPKQAYVYRFTYSLLSYLSLKLLLAHAPEQLFVPIVRLHLGTKDERADQDGFIRSLSKVLAHLLSTECVSNAQGFYMPEQLSGDRSRIWKLRNGLSSLYSVLPKRFKFTSPSPLSQLDKLALVIVSRRESDSKWWTPPSDKLSCLMGEVVSVERVNERTIESRLLHTFTDNYHVSKMDTHPTALIDEVGRLYQDGYRHFIYIAKSPYTSTLHLTEQPDEDNLFFMSRKVIQALKENRPDLKLYPVFFDTYSVVKLLPPFGAYPNASPPQSLFIQETRELQRIMEDSSTSKQVVIFYNLFNGIEVVRHYYNGVISYATLLGMYEDILEDADILRGLLLDENNPLKSDILNYLTLFHFSRYEAAGTRRQPISLKLNPYENLIGDQSVGKLAMWPHAAGNGQWNALAFLAEVRKILNQ